MDRNPEFQSVVLEAGKGLPTEIFCPSSVVKIRQIDETSIVGDKRAGSEKAYIEHTIIGTNCFIADNDRLIYCVLLDNVIVKQGCVLQHCVVGTKVSVEPNCNLLHCVLNAGASIGRSCNLSNCIVNPNKTVPPGTTASNQIWT